ncbi:hypothetical protein COCOBI_03-2380 [Coccomyxa sp. Obi]|nr:hypothetical protein COCOBI_03-2380 [Coccomyxa sp. Obi]
MVNPYSGKSTLASVLRVSALGVGLIYGSWKLSSLQKTAAKAKAKAESEGHH